MDDDLPSDLPHLRTLETWATRYLTRILTQIATVERQQPRPPRPRFRRAPPRPRPGLSPYAGLRLGGGRYRGHHHGDPPGHCGARGRPLEAVSTERARAELADGAQPCAVCRPDRVLDRPRAGCSARRMVYGSQPAQLISASLSGGVGGCASRLPRLRR